VPQRERSPESRGETLQVGREHDIAYEDGNDREGEVAGDRAVGSPTTPRMYEQPTKAADRDHMA
jgi:hypothetical protein